LGTGLGIKAAALGTAALVAAGVSTEIVRHAPAGHARVAATAALGSGRPAPAPLAGERVPASTVSLPAVSRIERVRPRATDGHQGKARPRSTTASSPTQTAAPVTQPARVLPAAAVDRSKHLPTASGRSH